MSWGAGGFVRLAGGLIMKFDDIGARMPVRSSKSGRPPTLLIIPGPDELIALRIRALSRAMQARRQKPAHPMDALQGLLFTTHRGETDWVVGARGAISSLAELAGHFGLQTQFNPSRFVDVADIASAESTVERIIGQDPRGAIMVIGPQESFGTVVNQIMLYAVERGLAPR